MAALIGIGETWLPVAGFEHAYEVSDQGRVRSLDRVVTYSTGAKHLHKGRTLKADYCPRGYRRVVLCDREKRKHTTPVHRIVARAFLGPLPDGCHVDHIDNNPSNNALSNLEAVDPSENVRRQIERDHSHNSLRESAKTHCPRGHLLEAPNLRPAGIRAGKRQCVVCDRARAYIQWNKKKGIDLSGEFQSISDRYYTNLMEEK